MSANVVNQVAFLRTSREFPEELDQLCVEVNKSYIDTANAVNNRTISIFPTNRPAINGESWFLTSRKQQGVRQVYSITGTGTYPHGITDFSVVQFVRIFGTFTDGTFWYPLPWVSVLSSTNNINIYLDSTNIVITGGGGGAQPTITSGTVVLEWINPP